MCCCMILYGEGRRQKQLYIGAWEWQLGSHLQIRFWWGTGAVTNEARLSAMPIKVGNQIYQMMK